LLERLSATTSATMRGLQDQAAAAQHHHEARHLASVTETAVLLNVQGEQMSRLADAVQRAEAAMRETVDRIKASTDSHLERISAGADRLMGASDRLSDNLGLMKSNSDGLTASADRLDAASGTLVNALAATQQALSDQKSVRDALAGMVADLRATVDNASREASVTSDLVNGIRQASERLTEAQEVSVVNLEDATNAIGDAHGAFARQVEVTLREGNRAFHEELAQAVGLLKGAIQDLGDTLDHVRSPA
jgi:chromosome segregation ATPase